MKGVEGKARVVGHADAVAMADPLAPSSGVLEGGLSLYFRTI
jgi:hypothetical protein